MIQNALTHWKTSTGGVAAAVGIFAAAYQPGMDWKHWLTAGLAALGTALVGIAASDAGKPN